MKAYRSLAALAVWFGLLLQDYLLVKGQAGAELAARTVRTAIALYTSVTAATYIVVLQALWTRRAYNGWRT